MFFILFLTDLKLKSWQFVVYYTKQTSQAALQSFGIEYNCIIHDVGV